MDLNGDGIQDVISGSWPGEIWWFAGGRGEHGVIFAKREMLKDKDGIPINPGGGLKEQDSKRVLIAGEVETERLPNGKRLKFSGRTLEIDRKIAVWTTGTACAAHAADWDGDGDFDLITGDIQGNVWFIENQGDQKTWSFAKERALEADRESIRVDGDAGPFVIDFDGDGDLDLLAGSGGGSVTLFTNDGTPRAPRLAAGVTLVANGEARWGEDAPREPVRGIRSKVCATDWNGDGRLDLLVGDFATQKPNRPDPTPEEAAEQARLRKERDEVTAAYGKRMAQLESDGAEPTPDEKAKLEQEMAELTEKRSALERQIIPEYEDHGWIWLFVQKVADPQRSGR